MNFRLRISLLFVLCFCSAQVLAHGEDTPGPHGGYVRMPGAFHTELVPGKNQAFDVYLLDINWTNPSVRSSKVDAHISQKKKSTRLVCEISGDHFRCRIPQGIDLKSGSIEVLAEREGQKGIPAIYNLPLVFQ